MSQIQESLTVSDLFVERVPAQDWRERAAAGNPASLFFNVRGIAAIGGEVVCVEFNLPASREGKFLKFPTAKADRNGVRIVVAPPRPSDHGAKIRTVTKDGTEVPALDENGMPVLLEPVSLPEGWTVLHTVKARVNVDRNLDIRMNDVEVTPVLKDGKPVIRTLAGTPRRCVKLIPHGGSLAVVERARIELALDEEPVKVGAGVDWRTRKSPAAAPAEVSAADAMIEAAAAAGRAARGEEEAYA